MSEETYAETVHSRLTHLQTLLAGMYALQVTILGGLLAIPASASLSTAIAGWQSAALAGLVLL